MWIGRGINEGVMYAMEGGSGRKEGWTFIRLDYSYIHLIFRIHKIMNLMGWHIFLNIINIFIWLLNTLQSCQWDGLFTTALLAWYLPQLQARSNLKDDCHRVLVPKSQVENILQCFGLIFILMDRLGALLSTLGANLVKERFFRDTLYIIGLIRNSQER